MTNVSEAVGTIELRGSKKSIQAMLCLIDQVTSFWHFQTKRLNPEPINDILCSVSKNKDTVAVKSVGAGRYRYQNTVEGLIPTLFDAYNDATLTPQQKQWVEQLNKEPLVMVFDYVDNEPSDYMLCIQTVELTWPKNSDIEHTPFDKVSTTVRVLRDDAYAYTGKNMDQLYASVGSPLLA